MTHELRAMIEDLAAGRCVPSRQRRAAEMLRAAETMHRALTEISAKCPDEDPGPAFDAFGWRSMGNVDDVAQDACDAALWRIAELARPALATAGAMFAYADDVRNADRHDPTEA